MNGPLDGKKIAIFAEQMFEDIELFYPKIRLAEAGAKITIIGNGESEYEGKNGLTIQTDTDSSSVDAADFDALVIPGGYSPDFMRRNEDMVSFVRDMHTQNKPIAAICHAPWMLAEADILEGVELTSFPSVRKDLENAGASWVDREVVDSNGIITSRNPDDLGAFCQAIIKSLNKAAFKKRDTASHSAQA